MEQHLMMAVDLGTSFIKVGVYDLDSQCIAAASEPVRDERPGPGIFIQHGEDLFHSVAACIRQVTGELGDRARQVEAIAFTGQMAGFMGVGEGWEDITGWSCSLDTRYTPYADRQMRQMKDDFLTISGTNSPLFSTKYQWFATEFPEEAKKIKKYLMISGYVIGRLGGIPVEEATLDGSFLAWTGLADVRGRCWSRVICDKLQFPMENLPRISQSNEIVARLSEQAAALTGLRSGIPLVSGAGDKIAGCVGANVLHKGDMIFEAASYAGLSCLVDDYRPDYEKKYFDLLAGAFPGDLYAHYYIPGSGITLNWFVENFVQREGESLKEAFNRIDRQVEQLQPGCSGLMAVGMLGGTAMPFDGDLKGIFLGADWSHRPAHFYRALQESFSYAVSMAIERINTKYADCAQPLVKIIGGGAKSAVWTQMLADVCGKTFQRLDREDVALWGACLLAADSVGLVADLQEKSAAHIHVKRTFTPRDEYRQRYDELRRQYQDYSEALSPYCKNLK